MKLRPLVIPVLLLCLGTTARADDWSKVFEVGAALGAYNNDYGNSDFEFARFVVAKANFNVIRVELSRASRFDDQGFGYGAWYSQYLPRGWMVMVGASAGTGDFIYPEHEYDAAVTKSMLERKNLFLTVFYARNHSKLANSFDRLGVNVEYRPGEHWILSANLRNERGHPGGADSPGGGIDAIWGTYRKRYFGGGIDYGDVAYLIVSENDALVDYHRVEVHGTVQWYVKDTSGWNAKASFEHNDNYDLGMVMGSWFWEW